MRVVVFLAFLIAVGGVTGCAESATSPVEIPLRQRGGTAEAALEVPEEPELVFEWSVPDRLELAPGAAMEVWAHSFGRATRLVARKPLAGGVQTLTLPLDETPGERILLRAAPTHHTSAVRWSTSLVQGLGAGSAERPSSDRPPDIVLVLIDTLRRDAVRAFGGKGRTPALDRLVATGIGFEEAYSTSSWTRPAVASLFSGLYPSSNQVLSKGHALPEPIFTLAERLRLGGYRTAAFHANNHVAELYHFDQGFSVYQFAGELSRPADLDPLHPEARFDHVPAETVYGQALDYLRRVPAEQPVFLYLHTVDPHEPYRPPVWLLPGERPGVNANPYLMKKVNAEGAPAELRRQLVRSYRGAVAYADLAVGRFLADAEATRRGQPRIVMVVSDHGESLFDRREGQRIGHKGRLWEEQIRIPIILQGKGVPRGERSGRRVSLVDVAPTLTALVGIPPSRHDRWSGTNMLDPPRAAGSRALTVEHPSLGFRALLISRWKLVRRAEPRRWSLFDLEDDPGETRDLSRRRPVLLRRLIERFEREEERHEALAVAPLPLRTDRLSPQVQRQLEALGYVE